MTDKKYKIVKTTKGFEVFIDNRTKGVFPSESMALTFIEFYQKIQKI